jgi:hypothetical protein
MSKGGEKKTRRELLRMGIGVASALPGAGTCIRTLHAKTAELRIISRLSPKNARRPLRPQTLYIVLHTTEGTEAGSLAKVRRRGETHYFVGINGTVMRIIDRAKIATHAGRSMWEGHRNIDNYAIGIEVVGYYNRDINEKQYASLRILLDQLKSLYDISDHRVLTHSMVAYGSPNQFHASDHRGRKRCGMIFARTDVRMKLGLTSKPEHDEDVESGRLRVADAELYRVLFAAGLGSASAAATGQAQSSAPGLRPQPPASAAPPPADSNVVTRTWTPWHIARERYAQADTLYVFPDGKRLRGDEIRDWSKVPEGTRVLSSAGEEADEQPLVGFLEIGKDGDTPRALAGDACGRETTIYFFPDGLIRTGSELAGSAATRSLLERSPLGTRILVGYVYGGFVKSSRPALRIAGIKWNYPSTYYRFPDGRIVSGDDIDDSAIPVRTLIFYQN